MKLRDFIRTLQGTRRRWQAALMALDAVVITLATVITYIARFDGIIPEKFAQSLLPMIVASIAVYVAVSWTFGLYQVVLRYVGIDTLLRVVGATLTSAAILAVGDIAVSAYLNWLRPVPIGIIFLQAFVVLIGLAGIRVTVRAAQHVRATSDHGGDHALIVGAGSAGSMLLREIQSRPTLGVNVVGFIDDNERIQGSIIGGMRVLGRTGQLDQLVADFEITELFVALPSAKDEYVRALLNRAADLGLTTRIMPKIVIERGTVALSDMRKVNVEDLLGRELTPIDTAAIGQTLTGKVVAVTGAAGSIGSELCRQILRMKPRELHLLEIDESRLYELHFELDAIAPGVARMHILDIRDREKVMRVFAHIAPHVVLHAAAYKHVPLMEAEPAEALRSNVIGTGNIIDAAAACDAERFVLISTDKAVEPANVMGKTKQLAERLMLARSSENPSLTCVAVRFGNVLGSRGSVVPIFEEKLLRGENLTVTDEAVTRYFMVIPEAARLVLQAQAIGEAGDIFVLEMGQPVRIVDLARKMIALSGIPADIEFVGLRPGEKLHEVLTNSSETLVATTAEKVQRVSRGELEPLSQETFSRIEDMVASETAPYSPSRKEPVSRMSVTPAEVLAL